jgi:hypothetical protein
MLNEFRKKIRGTRIENLFRILFALLRFRWPLFVAIVRLKVISKPKTFDQKVRFKMAHDRRKVLTVVADKVKFKEFVQERIGENFVAKNLFLGKSLDSLDFENIPRNFVLKAGHGSGGVILVADFAPMENSIDYKHPKVDWNKYFIHPEVVDYQLLASVAQKWMNQNYYAYPPGKYPEWAYREIQPTIIIEELLVGVEGGIPNDFKFFMFNGKCQIIQVDCNRFHDHRRDLFDLDWNWLSIKYNFQRSESPPRKPDELDKMLEIAERLAKDFDFIRIDFYLTLSGIKVGEMTNYPDAGDPRMLNFHPRIWRKIIGEDWIPQKSYYRDTRILKNL